MHDQSLSDPIAQDPRQALQTEGYTRRPARRLKSGFLPRRCLVGIRGHGDDGVEGWQVGVGSSNQGHAVRRPAGGEGAGHVAGLQGQSWVRVGVATIGVVAPPGSGLLLHVIFPKPDASLFSGGTGLQLLRGLYDTGLLLRRRVQIHPVKPAGHTRRSSAGRCQHAEHGQAVESELS